MAARGRTGIKAVTDNPVSETLEVDEAAFGVGAQQPHAHAVADVEPLLTALDTALYRRVEDADPRALRRSAGNDAVELLTDAARQEARGRGLPHHPLDLLRGVLFERAFRRQRAQLVLAVRNPFAGERRAHQALRDEIRIAPVRSRRVRVL